MSPKVRSAFVGAIVVLSGIALLAPAAQAAITPTLSLDQSAGRTAGGTANLGLDLKFTDTGSDSPDDLTIRLPPGLLANASIDGGKCLQTKSLLAACKVGSGTIDAEPLGLPLSVKNVPVSFDLVAPPAAGDLAGLAVNAAGIQLGTTAGIVVRPSGSADGVGLTINLVLPDTLSGLPISITQVNSTFDNLRYPTACPSTSADLDVAVNSYDVGAAHNLSAPLAVTGCSTLEYAPQLAVRVAKGKAAQVSLTTTVTEAANESPSRSLSLTFPGTTLGVNVGSINLLCSSLASGKCAPVGTATAVSPQYPVPLTANAYLVGTVSAVRLALVFPSPFPLTLYGPVNLITRTAAFTGLPDIPLTSLSLALNGGPDALFSTSCKPVTGTVTSKMVDQNSDKTVDPSVHYKVSGCPSSGSSHPPRGFSFGLVNVHATKLKTGHPRLSLGIVIASRSPKISRLTFELPKSLGLRRVRGKVAGIKVVGAAVKSLSVSGGHLVIVLRKPSGRLSVRATDLRESAALVRLARRGHLKPLPLVVIARDTAGARERASAKVS